MMKRNEKDIYDRIVELSDRHIDLCENSENIFLQEEKIKAVKNLYHQATDWDNPNRDKYKVQDEMHGRIVGNVMSYQLMDNEKYHEIEELLEILESGLDAASGISRANTFAGMGSYYQKSKTFNYGASPEKQRASVQKSMDPIKEIKALELVDIEDGTNEDVTGGRVPDGKGDGYF